MMKKWIACFMLLNACMVTDVTLWAKVTMPAIFSDHMVIQRDKPISVWGWAGKKERVKVTFGGKEYETKADAQGDWLCRSTVNLLDLNYREMPFETPNDFASLQFDGQPHHPLSHQGSHLVSGREQCG